MSYLDVSDYPKYLGIITTETDLSLVPSTDCASYGYDDWSDDYSLGCFDTYNSSSPIFNDKSVDNAIDLQWQWFLCNEPYVQFLPKYSLTSSCANKPR